MVVGLTRKQAEMLRYVGAFIARTGYSPSHREIGARLGLSPKSRAVIANRLLALQRRGYVTLHYGHSRSVRLTEAGEAYCKPFLKNVTPGMEARH